MDQIGQLMSAFAASQAAQVDRLMDDCTQTNEATTNSLGAGSKDLHDQAITFQQKLKVWEYLLSV